MSESRIRQSQIVSPQQFNVEARTSHIHRNLRYIAGLCDEKLRESLEKLDRSETLALAESRETSSFPSPRAADRSSSVAAPCSSSTPFANGSRSRRASLTGSCPA